MAKILYGVSGDGLGHATHAKEVADYLISSGHQVFFIGYNKSYGYLRPYFPQMEKVAGANLVYQNNTVQYLATFFANFQRSPQTMSSLRKISALAEQRQIDMVLTDFEPISCLVANLKGLPLVSLGNQHVLTRTKLDYPREYRKAYLTDRLITRLLVFNADHYLVLSFFPAVARDKKTTVLPPLIRREVLALKPAAGEEVLVYLTSGFEGIVKSLQGLGQQFIVYGLKRRGRLDNLLFKQLDRGQFLTDLAACRAVIATAGFSLISEALYLGKPYLALPAGLQFEQILNAYHLARLGYGEHHDRLTKEIVSGFLKRLPLYRRALGNFQVGNRALFAKLDELLQRYTA